MKKTRSILLLIVTSLLITLTANAQRPGIIMRANIILSVKDSLTKAPLEFVTAVLSKIGKNKDKEIFTYAISDSLGVIKFNSVPASDYEISLQYVGYFMKLIPNIKIDGKDLLKGDNIKDLGVIELKENVKELNAITIQDHIVPIKYLGDTIQYNAAAFKLSETDVLEDFFKKLPGWSVDNNGRITANGKVIQQITVIGNTSNLNESGTSLNNSVKSGDYSLGGNLNLAGKDNKLSADISYLLSHTNSSQEVNQERSGRE